MTSARDNLTDSLFFSLLFHNAAVEVTPAEAEPTTAPVEEEAPRERKSRWVDGTPGIADLLDGEPQRPSQLPASEDGVTLSMGGWLECSAPISYVCILTLICLKCKTIIELSCLRVFAASLTPIFMY